MSTKRNWLGTPTHVVRIWMLLTPLDGAVGQAMTQRALNVSPTSKCGSLERTVPVGFVSGAGLVVGGVTPRRPSTTPATRSAVARYPRSFGWNERWYRAVPSRSQTSGV